MRAKIMRLTSAINKRATQIERFEKKIDRLQKENDRDNKMIQWLAQGNKEADFAGNRDVSLKVEVTPGKKSESKGFFGNLPEGERKKKLDELENKGKTDKLTVGG